LSFRQKLGWSMIQLTNFVPKNALLELKLSSAAHSRRSEGQIWKDADISEGTSIFNSRSLEFETLHSHHLVNMFYLLSIDGIFSHLLLCNNLHFDAIPLHILLFNNQKLFELQSRMIFLFRHIFKLIISIDFIFYSALELLLSRQGCAFMDLTNDQLIASLTMKLFLSLFGL
jgi:hypothetical protein